MTDLGQRLRVARKAAGHTLAQLSVRCGYSVTHLSQIERGVAVPTIKAFERIARALGRPLAVFLDSPPLKEISLVRRASAAGEVADGAVERSLTEQIAGGQIRVSLVTIPGQSKAPSTFPIRSEWPRSLYVSEGNLRALVSGQELDCSVGTALHVAENEPLVCWSVGETPCRVLVVTLGVESGAG